MTLNEKQYELDGYTFGLGCDIEVKADGWVPGTASSRTQDQQNPSGDGIRFGKDYKAEAVWGFSLYTNKDTEEQAWAVLSELTRVWDARQTRLESGSVLPLRYRVAGQTRVLFGRPRRWTPTPGNMSIGGRIDVEADFTVVHPLFFEDSVEAVSIPLGVPLELDAGIVVPFIPPIIPNVGSATQESMIHVGGVEDTPLTITLTAGSAPLINPIVRVGDFFTAAIEDTIDPGNPLTLDARPWVNSITTLNGGTVRVAPRVTRLSQMWVPPGDHQVIFTGSDISSTATLMINWRGAHGSPR